MPKHPRKRQKTHGQLGSLLDGTKDARLDSAAARRAALEDDAAKDDEERRLESVLFGAVPARSKHDEDALVMDVDHEEEVDVGREFDALLDSDLFFVDEAAPSGSSAPAQLDSSITRGSDDDSDDSDDGDEKRASSRPTSPLRTRKGKAPAWTDPDDRTLEVSLASNDRLRKLRVGASEDTVRGPEYERRLRRQYERLHPAPLWASSTRTNEGDEGEDEDDLNVATGEKILPQGAIHIVRLRDANVSAPAEDAITTVRFHPSPAVPLLCVVSADRRVRLFNVDGHTNPLVHTLHIPDLPITHVHFHPGGRALLLTGPRPFIYTVDLDTLRATRTLLPPSTSNAKSSKNPDSAELAAISHDGTRVAIAARGGAIRIVDWASRRVVSTLKMHSAAVGLVWQQSGELVSVGKDAEVYVWDVPARRCVRKWKDPGAFGARVVTTGSGFLAIGSSTGYVSVYDETSGPRPLKALGHLTTPVSTVRFSPSGRLLALASADKKDQLRLIHTGSMTAVANWPTAGTPLGRVADVDFSPSGEYVVVGNARGRVLLYQMPEAERRSRSRRT